MAAAAESLDAPVVDVEVTLVSSDNQPFKVKKSHARISVLLVTMMDGDPDATSFPLAVGGDVLRVIVEYMTMHAGVEAPLIAQPLRDKNLAKVCKDPRDADFANALWGRSKELHYEVTKAANYMDIKGLLFICCAKIASAVKGEPVDKIPEILNPAIPA